MSNTQLNPGDFVRLKTDPTRAGRLLEGTRNQAGEVFVPVVFADGGRRYLPLSALELVPEIPDSIEQQMLAGSFAGLDWLKRTLMRYRVTGRLSDVVYSMEATDTDFYAHQFKPVLKLLNAPTDAILIADEVGLGKTIEAGLIWTELRARNDARRLLVICPRTLCKKWQIELERRFGVEARVVGADELLETLSSPQRVAKGFAYVASMSSLRPPKNWDKENVGESEAIRGTARIKLARLLEEKADEQPIFDLLVIDEAHHMRNPETLLYRLARLANAVSAHRVFLSATPIHLQNRDLHSLLHLIDPDTFSTEQVLNGIIEANAPIVAARELVLRSASTREEVAERIAEAQAHPLLAGNKTLGILKSQVLQADLDITSRSTIAWRLENANHLANFICRTRRRDVEEFRVVRQTTSVMVEMSAAERDFYDAITAAVAEYARSGNTNLRFLLSSAQRMLASSPAAASHYWMGENRLGMTEADDSFESDETIEDSLDERPLVSILAATASKLNMTNQLRDADSKYQALLDQLKKRWDVSPNEKIIIFSSFKPTLHYLSERFSVENIGAALLHGSISESRDSILEQFRENPQILILLSSEVGSEGVDLQFCSVVINYDLPWNPMRIEQRIGRVDRLGQKRETVQVLSLLYSGTIDERLYTRLYQRLELIQTALGGFEAILGEPIRDLTMKLLDPSLSEEQKAAAIEQTAQALETRRRHEEALEKEAGSFIAHGDYILNRILEARSLKRWIQGDDIFAYVKDRLVRSYPGTVIEASQPGADTHRVYLTAAAQADFNRFVTERGMKGLTRLVEGGDRRVVRFTSSVARRVSDGAENVSLVHPLVRFAAELDARDESALRPEPVAASLNLSDVDANHASELSAGTYVIGVRYWTLMDASGRASGTSQLAFAGARVGDQSPLRPELAEALVTTCAERGSFLPNPGHHPDLMQAVQMFESIVCSSLKRQFKDFMEQAKAELEDRLGFQLNSLERHLRNRTEVFATIQRRHEEQARIKEIAGDRQGAQRLRALAQAQEQKVSKLRETFRVRAAEIDRQRLVTPAETDVTALFIIIH